MEKPKAPKKGAVARFREFYNEKIRPNGPLSPELREIFQKKDKPSDKEKPKKSARPAADLEQP